MTWDEMVEATAKASKIYVPRAEADSLFRALIAAGYAIVPREADDSLLRLLARADSSLTDIARARTAWLAALAVGAITTTACQEPSSAPASRRQRRGRMDWQPIETAPRDGTEFLAALSNGGMAILSEVVGWNSFAWYRSSMEIPVARTHDRLSPDRLVATHWQPLPAHPTHRSRTAEEK